MDMRKHKCDSQAWIRNRGRSAICPVDYLALIEVRDRDGDFYEVKAGNLRWFHNGSGGDVMAWRLIDREQHAEPVEAKAAYPEMPAAKYFDGPLQWRDRIREIDSIVESLQVERAGLIANLESEGLQLLHGKVSGSVQPVEDMSDPASWRLGDMIQVVDPESSGLAAGKAYPIIELDIDAREEDRNYEMPCLLKGAATWLYAKNMRWHSRPTA